MSLKSQGYRLPADDLPPLRRIAGQPFVARPDELAGDDVSADAGSEVLLLAQSGGARSDASSSSGIQYTAPEVLATPESNVPPPKVVEAEGKWTWKGYAALGVGIVGIAGVIQSAQKKDDAAPPDTIPPTVTIVDDVDVAVTNGDRIGYTLTFSETVNGFSADDIVLGNGVLGEFVEVTGTAAPHTVFTFVVTPTPGMAGNVTVDVARNAATDLAGNANTAATRAVQAVDQVAPTLIVTVAERVLSAGETSVVTFAFSEPISGGLPTDIAAENATLSPWSTADGGKTWTAMLMPADYVTDSSNVVVLNSATIVDVAGNPLLGRVESNNYMVDTAALNLSEISRVAAGNGGFVINGHCAGDRSGWNVTTAGDVNGDGLADIMIGVPYANPVAGADGGRSYVVFGRTQQGSTTLSSIAAGNGGFVIDGELAGDRSGWSVAAAGDLNGDGLDDLIVGADRHDAPVGSDAGRSYIVFGRLNSGPIALSDIAAGNGGFVIGGHCQQDWSGGSVTAAGDVNGDGLGDLVIGAKGADPSTAQNGAGRTYVVFGQTAMNNLELSTIATGAGGFVINGQCSLDRSGFSVAGVGDVNGDGLADLAVGAYRADGPAGEYAGRTYVVFGRAAGTPVDLSAVAGGSGGFVIDGQSAHDQSGTRVAPAGDVNGDGLADLAVGAPNNGISYLVFGRAATTPLALSAVSAGNGGFIIVGQCTADQPGHTLTTAGDVNGDGLADLIVGAPYGDPGATDAAGRGYLVFGKTDSAGVSLSVVASGTGGFVINGHCADDRSNWSVAAGGDVDGDGLADLLVGAPGSDFSGLDAGRTYVVFGDIIGPFRRTSVDILGESGNDNLLATAPSQTLVGGAGNDILTPDGGSNVLVGGAGNDRFVLDADALAGLSAGVTDGNYARIDGGGGIDTLAVAGAGFFFDLRTIANPGRGVPGVDSRLDSIERIDLSGSGDNALALTWADVVDLAGMNLFNNANSWFDGTYDLAAGGANPERRHQLVVDGNAGDVVGASGFWAEAGTVSSAGNIYTVYNFGAYAQLLIDSDITRHLG